MKHRFTLATLVALLVGGIQAQGQSVLYTFGDGTSDGWASSGFGNSPANSVSSIGGQNYIYVPYIGFQSGNVASGYPGGLAGFNAAMMAAAADPSGYDLSYTYYINTAGFSGATFLQLGMFVNTGGGYYAQDYSTPNEVSFNGTQLASGQVFTGTVTINMAAVGFDMPPTNTFYRLGLIENTSSGATGVGVYYTDIGITAVPEPASLSLFGLAATGFWVIRRRNSVRRRTTSS